MGISVSGQAVLFLQTVVIGFFAGLLYDFFRTLRKAFKLPDFFTQLEDLLYWVLVMSGVFYFLLNQNYGELRGFFIAGIFIGMVFYFATLSPFVMAASDFLIGVLSIPLHFLLKLAEKSKKSVRKPLQSMKNYVTIRARLLRNGANRDGEADKNNI